MTPALSLHHADPASHKPAAFSFMERGRQSLRLLCRRHEPALQRRKPGRRDESYEELFEWFLGGTTAAAGSCQRGSDVFGPVWASSFRGRRDGSEHAHGLLADDSVSKRSANACRLAREFTQARTLVFVQTPYTTRCDRFFAGDKSCESES